MEGQSDCKRRCIEQLGKIQRALDTLVDAISELPGSESPPALGQPASEIHPAQPASKMSPVLEQFGNAHSALNKLVEEIREFSEVERLEARWSSREVDEAFARVQSLGQPRSDCNFVEKMSAFDKFDPRFSLSRDRDSSSTAL